MGRRWWGIMMRRKGADVRSSLLTISKSVFAAKVDQVKQFTVFDIGGNKFRLITVIDYDRKKVFIRHVLTHKEYDQEKWKKDSFRIRKPKSRQAGNERDKRKT